MKNSLVKTNKHLKSPIKRKKMIVRFAYSAGKHEGLKITLKDTYRIYEKINNL